MAAHAPAVGERSTKRVHVCFHGIGIPTRQLEAGEEDYWVSESFFTRVVDELAATPNARVSFDDGNLSDLTVALPALAERGMTARFFPLAGRLGSAGSLDRDAIRHLADYGMTIGSHGMHHRRWPDLGEADRRAELVEARAVLADAAGRPIEEVACPFGMYNRSVLRDLRRLGYRRVHTSDRAPVSAGEWLEPRYSAHRAETPERFLSKVLATPSPATRLERRIVRTVKRWR